MSEVLIYHPTMRVVSSMASDTMFWNASDQKFGLFITSADQSTELLEASDHAHDKSPITMAHAFMREVFMNPHTITVESSMASDTRFWYASDPRFGLFVTSAEA